eukprot:2904494-Pyramimonas_sp.AAC.1
MKQGCPLSALIFVIIFDPVVRGLQRRLCPHPGLPLACADDIGIATGDLRLTVPMVLSWMSDTGIVTGLRLHTGKCWVVIALDMDIEVAKQRLRDLDIPVDEVQIGPHAKYLGVYLGPEGSAASWRGPCRKLLERVAHIRELKISLAQNIRAYNMLAFPVLSHISQFYMADSRVYDTEHVALQRLTAAPRHSIATALLKNLGSLGFDAAPRDIS